MLTQDEVIALAREAGFVGYGEDLGEYRIPAPAFISRLNRVAQACYDAGAKAENEACAVAAWKHYADVCKRLTLNPHHYSEWIASGAIRERGK